MPCVPASSTSSGYGSAPAYASACSDSRPTCGPLPCTTTMLCSAASGAIACAATVMFRRWTSVVIGLAAPQQRVAAQGEHDAHLRASSIGDLA